MCLHVDNGDIDISPCSLLVAKRFTLDRLCCTKHFDPRSICFSSVSQKPLWFTPSCFASESNRGAGTRQQTCHCSPGTRLAVSLVQLATLTQDTDITDETISSWKFTFLSLCFSEASSSCRVGGGGGCAYRGQSIVTDPQTSLTFIKSEQKVAKQGNFVTTLLCEALKYTC